MTDNTIPHLQLVPEKHCGKLLNKRERLPKAFAKVWQDEIALQQAMNEEDLDSAQTR